MSGMCHGLCANERNANKINYDKGWKRCTTCYKKIMTDSIFCYCCRCRLRNGARTSKSKIKKEYNRI